jgi:hypothetical protein
MFECNVEALDSLLFFAGVSNFEGLKLGKSVGKRREMSGNPPKFLDRVLSIRQSLNSDRQQPKARHQAR